MKGLNMKKKVLISIDEEVNERWNKVCKRLELSKSGMVEEFVLQMLPILEQQTPNNMIASAMKEMAKQIDLSASLFDTPTYDERAIYDESVEDYKNKKKADKLLKELKVLK